MQRPEKMYSISWGKGEARGAPPLMPDTLIHTWGTATFGPPKRREVAASLVGDTRAQLRPVISGAARSVGREPDAQPEKTFARGLAAAETLTRAAGRPKISHLRPTIFDTSDDLFLENLTQRPPAVSETLTL